MSSSSPKRPRIAGEPCLRIPSTFGLTECSQPPAFQQHLRSDQLALLSWMVDQEAKQTFESEQVPWSLPDEPILGGILADAPGFGKTATAIALVVLSALPEPTSAHVNGRIMTNATLIVCPRNLVDQWATEIEKFLGTNQTTVVLRSLCDLKRCTYGSIITANFVICSCQQLTTQSYIRARQELLSTWRAIEGGRTRAPWTFQDATCALLRNMPTTWQNSRSPLLEQFQWARFIMDEFHEIDMMQAETRKCLMNLHVNRRWGLTGTPSIAKPSDVLAMAALFGISWHGVDCSSPAQLFLDTFVRRNELPPDFPSSVQLCQHIVEVRQNPHEHALYIQQVHGASEGQQALMLCSHFSLGADANTRDSPLEECEFLRLAKKERADKLHSLTASLLARLELLLQVIARAVQASGSDNSAPMAMDAKRVEHAVASLLGEMKHRGPPEAGTAIEQFKSILADIGLDELRKTCKACQDNGTASKLWLIGKLQLRLLSRIEDDTTYAEFVTEKRRAALRSFMLTEVGRDASLADEKMLRSALNALKFSLLGPTGLLCSFQDAVRSEKFLQTQLTLLAENLTLPTCSICMSETCIADTPAITHCAHIFGLDCILPISHSIGKCPLCQADMPPAKLYSLRSELSSAPASDEPFLRSLTRYGSKISRVVALIGHLRVEDPACKVLLFCQWRSLEEKLVSALHAIGTPCLYLHGSVAMRSKTLARFRNPQASEGVLILSLENSAGGMNLVEANHCILFHPMWAASKDQASAYEMQAISRCWRPGQAKTVHVWRFVTKDTMEEKLISEYEEGLWRQHVASSVEVSMGARAAGLTRMSDHAVNRMSGRCFQQ